MNKLRTLRVFDANLLFLIGSLLFFTIGFTVQQRELYTGLIITQLAVVLLPPFLYLELRRMNVRQILRLNTISVRQAVLAALITIFMYPAAVTANLFMLNLLSRIGNLEIPQLPAASSPFEYLRLMLIVSLLAGVCEEVFFRGFIMRGYESLGQGKAVVITAFLFGIFHYNIYNLMGAIMLGLVFGMLVKVTGSLYAGIVGHIVNNGFAVTLSYAFTLLAQWMPTEEMQLAEETVSDSLLASLLFFGVLAILGMGVSWYLYRKLETSSSPQQAISTSTPPSLVSDDSSAASSVTSNDEEKAAESRLGDDPQPEQASQNSEKQVLETGNGEPLPDGQPPLVQWWEFFPLTGVIPLFIHILLIQISMILGRF
ncbi:type II CAAX endopeptidase family protein [Anoxynatronum sibiricum]|uniref:Type II CAAX endopeptidase family protein n=1 Tax=Anoxynatronum sibiricum TaxID=210623 RepID=A0ABU9VYI1_9CLOT